ncbi:RsfA family transcriptional regulator [Domibacillus robiginosus]|uniref:RsfA family transcriptional regulator n=1 Tax=Domibacillus robiginosus TaxID=1071054 RepID=UPI00067A87C2|nr:RsfA family transcriptional regulator [Domibacillus robiginosus]
MNIRQDAWSKDNDLFLANTVLKHVREGSTQLKAFEEVGEVLNRTGAACGFRWNAVVRQHYIQAMETAKKERKQRLRAQSKRASAKPEGDSLSSNPSDSYMTMADVIQYLSTMTSEENAASLQEENKRLKAELETVTSELNQLKDVYNAMQEDYESLMQIMERARKLVVFSEESPPAVKFKMERNGNLEKVAE